MIVSPLARILCCIVILVVVVIVIIAIVLAATFKMPDVSVKSITLAANPPPKVNVENGGSVVFTWNVVTSVKNNWQYDLYLSSIGVSTELVAVPGYSLGDGQTNDVNLVSKQPQELMLPMNVNLKGSDPKNVDALRQFAQCATGDGSIPIKYTLYIWAKVSS